MSMCVNDVVVEMTGSRVVRGRRSSFVDSCTSTHTRCCRQCSFFSFCRRIDELHDHAFRLQSAFRAFFPPTVLRKSRVTLLPLLLPHTATRPPRAPRPRPRRPLSKAATTARGARAAAHALEPRRRGTAYARAPRAEADRTYFKVYISRGPSIWLRPASRPLLPRLHAKSNTGVTLHFLFHAP